MTSHLPVVSSCPIWILNGHSIHVEEAQAHIAKISDEFGLQAHVVVTGRGDDISSLVARVASENISRWWRGEATGPPAPWPASWQAPMLPLVFSRWAR